ncbi:hypothetical protein [Methylobacterium oryzae]|uniref:hypothetical protein n=1 Tax=Methylobacterium oryzae TaxID=334852 RepID=UPI002F3433CA
MPADNTNQIIANDGPFSAAFKTMGDAQDLPWLSDGSAEQERRAGLYEATRALEEGFDDRSELLELSTAAYRGPVALARRIRETEFGSKDFPKRCSFGAFLAHLFGDEGANGEFASAYVYALQVILPFICSVH